MLLFTAFNSTQNQVAPIYKSLNYDNLGVVSLMALYGCFGFVSFFSA
jgi:hypothetical protein